MVFVRQSGEKECYPVATMLGMDVVKGDIGLEIEVEGNKFQKSQLPSGWTYHNDGSLRGQDNAEYLFTKPVAFKDAGKLLDSLWKMFKDYGSVLAKSNRTSVHAHLNVSHFHLNRLTSLLALWFACEEVLTEWCGEHRVGNLFCLRAKDAPAIITNITAFIQADMEYKFHDGHHYAAMAVDAIRRHGSVEIRTLSGVQDPETIKVWVEILQKLYDKSGEYPDPRSICETFSGIGPMAFFENLFGELASVIAANMDEDFIRQSLYEGVRMYAQDICYAKNWDTFVAKDLRPDPFGRSPRRSKPATVDLESGSNAAFLQQYLSTHSLSPFSAPAQPAPQEPDWAMPPDISEEF